MAYEELIDRLFSTPIDRALATGFVQRFEGQPFADRVISTVLREAAAANARVLAGELTPAQGRDLVVSLASEGAGIPPHIVADGMAWFDDVSAELAQQADGEDAEPRGAEPPGPHADTIRRLFAPQERAAAAALAKALDAHPESASRTEAILHEISRTTGMSPEESYRYISSFAESIGVPSHLVTSALDAISAPAERAHEAEVTRELVGDLTPAARHAHVVAAREAAQKDVAKYESMMRAPEGSAEWRGCWKDNNAQMAYRAALEASLVEPPAMPLAAPPAAPAPAPEPPAPAAEPAVPAG
jgi:hypothetical protein